MPSRSRSRKSSRSSGRNPFKSASILENGGQAPLKDTLRDDIELVSRNSQSTLDDFPSPFAGVSAPSRGAPSTPATDESMEPRNEPGSTGTRIDPSASGQRDRLPHKRFGLHTDQIRGQRPQGGSPMDYKQRYPEDPIYKETGPNARVFHVYNDESQLFDNDMIIEAGDSLDILLVFAGLFASVLTTFVVQTSQSLSPDKTDISNSLLREMISLQRAQENGTSFSSVPTADTSFTASRSDVWVNSLWFISLSLSLSTALLAVIAKQWLRQYSSFISGTPRDRALIRQFRYDGLEKWGVRLIIGLLPTILHISLFLFLAGVVVFLLSLNNTLACVVAGITGFLCATYIITNLLPVISIQCPYRTPLSEILNSLYGAGCVTLVAPWFLMLLLLRYINVLPHGVIDRSDTVWIPQAIAMFGWEGFTYLWPSPLKESERACANATDKWGRPLWIDGALSWLAETTSDMSAKAIVAEAAGSLSRPSLTSASEWTSVKDAIFLHWPNILSRDNTGVFLTVEEERIAERIIRGASITQSRILYALYKRAEPIHCHTHGVMLMLAVCNCPSIFHTDGEEPKDLSPAQVFSFVAGRKDLSEELEAPRWIWWSVCIQATQDLSYEQIIELCRNGSIANIDSHRETWLEKVNIPSTLRRAVWEHMLDAYRDEEDFGETTKPYTFLQFSKLFVRQSPPSPFSTVSLAMFLFDNFSQFTEFWIDAGDIHLDTRSNTDTNNPL